MEKNRGHVKGDMRIYKKYTCDDITFIFSGFIEKQSAGIFRTFCQHLNLPE